MLNRINLSNLKACQQNWSEMTPTDRGRVCGKCKKTIIDFRGMTDQEVAHIHVFEDRQVCGVYRPDQLAMPTKIIHPAEASSWKSIVVGMAGLLSGVQISAQNESTVIATEQLEIDPEHKPETIIEEKNEQSVAKQDSIIISGVVKSFQGNPIQFGVVVVKGTEKGTTTSMEGFYSLDITDQITETGMVTLEYRYLGYMDTEVQLSLDSLGTATSRNIDVTFPDSSIQQEIQVTQFYAVVKSEKKSLWRKFINLFKRKNKKDK